MGTSAWITEAVMLVERIDYVCFPLIYWWCRDWLGVSPQFTLGSSHVLTLVQSSHAGYWNCLTCVSSRQWLTTILRWWCRLMLLNPILISKSNHLGAYLLITHRSLFSSIQVRDTLFGCQTILCRLVLLRILTCCLTHNSCLVITLVFLGSCLRMLSTTWRVVGSGDAMNGTAIHTPIDE